MKSNFAEARLCRKTKLKKSAISRSDEGISRYRKSPTRFATLVNKKLSQNLKETVQRQAGRFHFTSTGQVRQRESQTSFPRMTRTFILPQKSL